MTTFVLIHGAYQGGWIWNPVATRLRAEGHLVHAPSLDGCGERAAQIRPGITTESQAEEIASLLYHEDLSEVVLVGTSAGGMVAAKTAELARERVERLVLVDAPLASVDAEYTYDPRGNLIEVNLIDQLPTDPFEAWRQDTIPAGQKRTFVYDAAGRLESSDIPESGQTAIAAYDAGGNTLVWQDQLGLTRGLYTVWGS